MDGTRRAATPRVRFVADDRISHYRIERELGATPGGVLYQVTHLVLPRRAVIKVPHPNPTPGTCDRQALAVLLLREACLLEALQHPGVPQLYESGILEDRRPWFAVERIEGGTLAELIARGPIEPLEVAALVRDVADVLAHAHRRGVIHHGLRPDRIVLTPERRFPLCIPDWSGARAHDASVDHAPPPHGHYIAPDLARGDPADDRADVFALGVIAYLAITGARPFDRDTSAPFVPTRARRATTPRPLARLIDQMLAPDRFDRPAALEIHAELAQLVTDEPEVVDLAATTLRIRRPRWTPPMHVASPANDLVDRGGVLGDDPDGWADS